MKTTSQFLAMKQQHEKIVMVTAYDYPGAKFSEQAEVDMILVGDSLGILPHRDEIYNVYRCRYAVWFLSWRCQRNIKNSGAHDAGNERQCFEGGRCR